jgi:hypothetical protein
MRITITASASGSLTPPTAPPADTVANGDFLIGSNPAGGITGDGQDEETNWTFKFAGDSNFPFFSPSRPLTSALLTLTLTPKDGLITTDGVLIEGLGIIGGSTLNAPEIQGLPVSVTNTIHIELLNRLPAYSSAAILGVFSAGGGQIPMRYADDAILSSAKLELTQEAPAFQYAAKFVCGKSAGEVVAPGVYFTAVNVHNPTYTAIRFRIKIAVALPGVKPGPVSKFFDAKLGPDQALEIDCRDIFEHAETKADFLKGFVVIESDVELDVVAVYTAAGRDGQVETLHTERVPPRRLELGRPAASPSLFSVTSTALRLPLSPRGIPIDRGGFDPLPKDIAEEGKECYEECEAVFALRAANVLLLHAHADSLLIQYGPNDIRYLDARRAADQAEDDAKERLRECLRQCPILYVNFAKTVANLIVKYLG